MDKIFERLANLARSFFNDLTDGQEESGGNRHRYVDPDEQDAWDELNDFLNDEESGSGTGSTSGRQESRSKSSYTGSGTQKDPQLVQDFKNLEVPFGTPLPQVKKAYKTLLKKYHPDRFARDPGKFKSATEYTAKINQSYDRIEKYYSKK